MSVFLHICWACVLLGTLLLLATAQYWLGHLLDTDYTISGIGSKYDVINVTLLTAGVEDERQIQEFIEVSEILPNCGIQSECPQNTFPVHIYTGQDKDDQPKLCVHGKYIIGGNINGGGRGLNAAIIESTHLNIVSVQNFDLYSQNSSTLEVWLVNQVHENDIIIAFTFDEASKELSKKAKTTLYKLGSGKIQDLQFRSQWYMISQKGIKGFTALERLTFAKNDHWGDVIDERICVPKEIPSVTITPDAFPRKNSLRESLCNETPQLKCHEFCNALAKHEVITPALLTNRSLLGNTVYSSPVIIIAGEINSLVYTLESVIQQSGIHTPSVLIIYDRRSEHVNIPMLANLYSFQHFLVNASSASEKIYCGIKRAKEQFPNKKYFIVIDEGLILSPDFLYYMAQMVPLLENDESLLGISAWNPNGYEKVSMSPHTVFRAEDFPGAGFMIPVRVFDKYINGNFLNCCSSLSILGWEEVIRASGGEIIYPEVSRVLLRPLNILKNQFSFETLVDLVSIPRITNIDAGAWIEHRQDLLKEPYYKKLETIIQHSTSIHLSQSDLSTCQIDNDILITDIIQMRSSYRMAYAFYYKETSCGTFFSLKNLTECFGMTLPSSLDYKPQGLYKNTLRFSYNSSSVILIESSSPFYKSIQGSVSI
ncbi:protein O-linked-mannose beta-1,2-N-acetylglucosaminyltransferase 1-like isoform X2 [Lycorma delicatula]|uniref:protein O-linked-mannose beta-1,2-N-acetylglucosaminyltransferase 1-like isoform X2 n=1 Tax=Lycorma delicatula TaxID=130591 RepID=UPI003F51203C